MAADYENRDIKEVDIEFNNSGTKATDSWDKNIRVILRSNDIKDTLDEMILKATKIIDGNKVK